MEKIWKIRTNGKKVKVILRSQPFHIYSKTQLWPRPLFQIFHIAFMTSKWILQFSRFSRIRGNTETACRTLPRRKIVPGFSLQKSRITFLFLHWHPLMVFSISFFSLLCLAKTGLTEFVLRRGLGKTLITESL